MGGLIIGGGLLAMGLLLFGGKRARRSPARRAADSVESVAICGMTAAQVAGRNRATLLQWLECDGRTALDAAALERALRAAGATSDAEAVRARWNAIREVLDSPADGQLTDPAEADAARRADAGEDVPLGTVEMGEPVVINTARARSLVGQLVRALRRRSNYRTLLTEFQSAAGIAADGQYGGQSYNAIRYFGGDPPAPFRAPAPSAPAAQYPPQLP